MYVNKESEQTINIRDYADLLDLSIEHKFKLITQKFDIITQNDIIVDIGCGTANLTNKIANHYPQAITYGLENSDTMHDIAVSNSTKANIIKINATEKYFDDNSIKIFYISSCCHEIKSFSSKGSIERLFQNIYDCLRNNGQLIIRDFIKPISDHKILITKNNFQSYINKFNEEFYLKNLIDNNICSIASFYEFAIHTKYTNNWLNEIREEYAWITSDELFLLLSNIGFKKIIINYEYNNFIMDHIKNNFEVIKIKDEDNKNADNNDEINMETIFPSHMILSAYK